MSIPRLSVTLRSQDDRRSLVKDLGDHLADLWFTTASNAGFYEAGAQYVSHTANGKSVLVDAINVFRRWRFCVVRVYVNSLEAWCGRIWKIKLTNFNRDKYGVVLCNVEFEMSGFWRDLTLLLQHLNPDYIDQGTSVSASDLVKMVVGGKGDWWLIEETFTQVEDTGGNIAPLKLSEADYAHDLIVAAFQKGTPNNDEFYYGIYEPRDGPFVRSRTKGPVLYRGEICESDTSIVWDGEQYVSKSQSTFQDVVTNSSNTTGVINSPVGEELHGGVQKQSMLSLGDTTKMAAEDTDGLYILQHYDPVGLDGSLKFGYSIDSINGGRIPSWLVRSGQGIELTDLLAHDPYFSIGGRLRRYIIEETRFSITEGLEITVDQRPLMSRRHEKVSTWQNELRALKPLMPGQTRAKLEYNDVITITIAQTASGNDIELTDAGYLEWDQFTAEEVEIAMQIQYSSAGASMNSGVAYYGYTLDFEDFSGTNLSQAASIGFKDPQGTDYLTSHSTFKRPVGPGYHFIRFWVKFPDQTGKSNVRVRGLHASVK